MVHRGLHLQAVRINGHKLIELLLSEVKAAPVDVLVTGHETDLSLESTDLTAGTLNHPAENAGVVSEARPQELASLGITAEPVDVEDHGLVLQDLTHVEVVLEVVGHVVTAEGKHSHGIVTKNTLLAILLSRSGLRSDSSTSVDTMLPVEGLEDQRNVSHATATEAEDGNGNTLWIIPVRIEDGAVSDRCGEA